ncbi:hypothetical protein PROFUN_12985 [Planoprotostelium fungivorum]|uniref:Uncharacterized protein n=1 Tax=Planoprotostelium fungivorum TaxID=1890364 RepID=A0A2P6N627_9EUKA|nr:hypothetical protein PROFUN_12985 [Planoprotostelium fungivorum]
MASAKAPVLSKDEIVKRFRLDIGSGLEWKSWEPGGEHLKKLTIRNIDVKTQHIKYALPSTRYFGMDFPETFVLSPGMSCTVTVVFRPIEYHFYEDVIPFTTDGGVFGVRITATVPTIEVQTPESVDFGRVPSAEIATQTIQIQNSGQRLFHYHWKLNEPFHITPAVGTLAIGKSTTFTVHFSPKEAGVWQASAVLQAGAGEEAKYREIIVRGVSKLPFITSSLPSLNYGEVLVGRTSEKQFNITNNSLVRTSYTISRQEPTSESFFVASTSHGSLEAGASACVTITFSSSCPGSTSSDTFVISTPGGNTVKVDCVAKSVGPKLTFSTTSFNFGSVTVGTITSRILTVQNHSKEPAQIQFGMETRGIFGVDLKHSQTTINSKASAEIKFSFSPTEPMNYYKRIFIIVQHEDVQYLDLIGTGYTPKARPPDMSQKHIDVARSRVTAGLNFLPPEALESVSMDDIPPEVELLDIDRRHGIFSEFFEHDHTRDEVGLSSEFVNFGACSSMREAEGRSIRFNNRTQGKVTVVWAPVDDPEKGKIFHVTPPIADVGPGQELQFRINFTPHLENQFYGQRVECYVYYKTMRNFQLVTDKTITAPWCLSTFAYGHTFPPGRETFLPNAQFQSKLLYFPVCHISDTVYQTATLSNQGDTAVDFQIMAASEHRGFDFKPSRGTLQPNQNQLVLMQYTPQECRPVVHHLRCIMNNSVDNCLQISIKGRGALPQLNVIPENLYLKPTCVGLVTERTVKLYNPTCISIAYSIEIPEKYRDIISFDKSSGNETIDVNAIFCPRKKKKYIMKLVVKISSDGLPHSAPIVHREVPLRIVGEGSLGMLAMEPPVLSFENVLVGSQPTREVTLINKSDCYVEYVLDFEEDLTRGNIAETPLLTGQRVMLGALPQTYPVFSISPREGTIPAHGSQTITITFCPDRHNFYTFLLSGKLKISSQPTSAGNAPRFDGEASSFLCEIIGIGVYPQGISTHRVHTLFDVQNINYELVSDLQPYEVKLSKMQGLVAHSDVLQQLKTFQWNFGSGPFRTEAATAFVTFKNTGGIPVDWSFNFLSRLEVAKESWVDLGKQSDADREQAFIIEHKIFLISPSSGLLQPNETVRVGMTYHHHHAGRHQTQVLFRVSNGKQLKIDLRGETLQIQESHLSFSKNWEFDSVPFGALDPPRHTFDLLNDSDVKVDWGLELDEMKAINQKNYDFPIFECLNPSGSIEPGKAAPVEFIFTPLEAKRYHFQAVIKYMRLGVQHREKIQISAQGYSISDNRSVQEIQSEWDADDLPKRQEEVVPGQLVKLSAEDIHLGTLVEHSSTHRIVTLKNISLVAIRYEWITTGPRVSSYVQVEPMSGELLPGDHVISKITLTTRGAELFHVELPLHVINLNEILKQQRLMDANDEDKIEFVVKENGEMETIKVDDLSPRSASSNMTNTTAHSQTPLKKKLDTNYKRPTKKIALVRKEETLFVTLRARVETISTIRQKQLPLEKFPTVSKATRLDIPVGNHHTSPSEGVHDLMGEVLSDMLHDAIHSLDITGIVNEIAQEPSPYFCQIFTTPLHAVESKIPTIHQEEKKLFASDEFQEMMESVLEETVFNLMQEISFGEFDATKNPKLVLSSYADSSHVLQQMNEEPAEARAAAYRLAMQSRRVKFEDATDSRIV